MKKITAHLVWISGLLLISILTGCASQDKSMKLDDTLRAYEKTIRWVAWDRTNNFRKEPIVLSTADRERLKPIKVTGYKALSVTRKPNEIRLLVEIRYYNEQYARVKTIQDEQLWQYDEKTENWFIHSPLPYFK